MLSRLARRTMATAARPTVTLLISLATLLIVSSCARVLTRNPLPLKRLCIDNQPIKILQDARCPLGVCGYTCAPDRWRDAATTPP
jgi:hypothetical protein